MANETIGENKFSDEALLHLDALWQTAHWFADNEHDVEDLVMNTYIKASRFGNGYFSKANSKIRLFKILMNILSGRFQLNFRAHLTDNVEKINELIPSDKGFAIEAIPGDFINRAIRNLPLEYRLIMVLSILEKFTYSEIADLIGVSRKIVRLKIYQGYMLIHREIFNSFGAGGKNEAFG